MSIRLTPVRGLSTHAAPKLVNRLIAALPRADRARLLAACSTVELVLGEVLCEPGARLRHAWFPLDGFISLLNIAERHAQLEIGLIGDEGMFGLPLTLGAAVSSQRALVQGAGTALRIDAAALRRELQRSHALRRVLGLYAHVLMTQLAQIATCIGFHVVEQRLARWLLMTHDRARRDTFDITHAFLATMLGVRRVGVTEAASALQKKDLIRYSRGRVTIANRRGLEVAACGCYRSDRDTWQHWLG